MKVARWGHALAVRLPASVVNDLGLVEGDEINLVCNRKGNFEVAFTQRQQRAGEWLSPQRKGLSAQFFENWDESPPGPAGTTG